MSLTIYPNQALAFNIQDEACKCGGSFCQPFQFNDFVHLQGAVTTKGSNFYGPFDNVKWTLPGGGNYSITGGKLFKTMSNDTGFVVTTNPIGLVVGKMYRIEVKVNITDPGTTATDHGFVIHVNGDALKLPATTLEGGYNQSFHAVWYIKVNNVGDDQVTINTTADDIEFNVEYLNFQQVSQVGLAMYDNAGAETFLSLTPSGLLYGAALKYNATNDLIYAFLNTDSDALAWFLPIANFAGLTGSVNGCYRLSVFDASTGADDMAHLTPCLDLRSTHDCTILCTATNNDGAFGFLYPFMSGGVTQTFIHSLRVKAKMDVTSYPEESETYIFSDNSEALLFGRTQKEHSIFLSDAPVYIHDCLRHMRLHDLFKIDGAEYVKDGAYELNRRKTSSLKQATFTVREAEGIASNYRLS